MAIALLALAILSGQSSNRAPPNLVESQTETIDTGPICLNKPISTCVRELKPLFKIINGELEESLITWGKVDVSGKPVIGKTNIFVQFQFAKDVKLHHFRHLHVRLDSKGYVGNIGMDFDYGDPGTANTKEEYDETGLFDILAPMLPSGCAQKDRLNLYRFFNDVIKPTISLPDRETFVGIDFADDSIKYRSDRVPMCGLFIDYRKDRGVGTQMMSIDNPSGRYTKIEMIIWNEPALWQRKKRY